MATNPAAGPAGGPVKSVWFCSAAAEYPENTCTNFRNKMPSLRELFPDKKPNEDYYIGLAQIHYPNKIENVSSRGNTIRLTQNKGAARGAARTHELPPKYYASPADVVAGLNALLGASFLRTNFSFAISEAEDRCLIQFRATNRFRLEIGADIAGILGFEPGRPLFDTKVIKSPFHTSTRGSRDQLLLYMDGVAPSFFAGVPLDLLALIPWGASGAGPGGEQHSSTSYTMEQTQWHKLYPGMSAHFSLRNLSGEPIAFQGGTVILRAVLTVR